jgi:hypothetical protein
MNPPTLRNASRRRAKDSKSVVAAAGVSVWAPANPSSGVILGPTSPSGEPGHTPEHSDRDLSNGRSRSSDIDVVIPTYNWSGPLAKCLEGIRRQAYEGTVNIYVVDAGSTDATVDVAHEFGAKVIERIDSNPQGEGLDGRRWFGLLKASSPLVWHLDGDNFIVEDTALRDLSAPLAADSNLAISVPYPYVNPTAAPFNRWWSYRTILRLERMRARGIPTGGWTSVRDMEYGLMNGTLIRRAALDLVGGWDQDVRILRRLRSRGLANGAIVPSAHVDSPTNSGIRETRTKFSRRVTKFGSMPVDRVRSYFADYDHPENEREPGPSLAYASGLFTEPLEALSIYRMTRDPAAFYGMTVPLIYLSIALEHPIDSFRVLRRDI